MAAESATAPYLRGPAGGVMPVIGLRREREVLTVALQAARHVVLEGPPGTGKSTLLRSIARDLGQAVVFVEGNAELTPARLVGQYDPAQVLAEGYLPSSFADGPLLQAMRAGALLYLEEFNRVPEETLNVLITVLTEGEIAVPRYGAVQADPQFRLIAAMNPFDAIGTARVSQAIADRICRVVLGYQDAAAEQSIVRAITGRDGAVVSFAVAFTRATRAHRGVRMGSSVRGAIDLVLLIDGLTRLRGEAFMMRQTALDAAYAALSGRIRIVDGCDRSAESVLDEILGQLWPEDAAEPAPLDDSPDGSDESNGSDGSDGSDGSPGGQGKADGPLYDAGLTQPGGSRSSLRRERRQGPARRTVSRAELASRHQDFADVSPEAGSLDADALAALLAANPDAAAALLADLSQATDAPLRAIARQLATRVFIQLGAVGRQPRRGSPRRLRSALHGDGDIDLDRTLDRLSGSWPPSADDLVTRSWQAQRRSVCLLVDCSGSMSGHALAMAAVASASVLLAADSRLDTGAAAFSGTVTVLQAPGSRQDPEEIVGRLLALRGHGMTDIATALRSAAMLLSRPGQLSGLAGGPAERCVILLSDCLRTAGSDPAAALDGIDRLDVLCPLPAGAEPDPASFAGAERLARLGGGLSKPVRTLRDIPAALTQLLSGR
ncbi:MAG TPA: AAA family ATPase [Streptosporangiaceae bacterium]|nr:AAA family ATPase [Streptosporangiaceae bacterium]